MTKPKNKIKTLFRKLTKERLEKIELVIRIIAIGIAAAWAIFTFYYQNATLPSYEPTSMNFQSQFEKLAENDSLYFFKLTISIQNNSKITERFIACIYNIRGCNFMFDSNMSASQQLADLKAGESVVRGFALDTNSNEEISYGKILQNNSVLNPGQQFVIERVIPIKKYKFNLCQLTMNGVLQKMSGEVLASCYVAKDGMYSFKLLVPVSHGFFKNTVGSKTIDYKTSAQYGVYYTSAHNTYLIDSGLLIN